MMTFLCLSNPDLNWCFLSALQAHKGLRGIVRDRSGKPIAGAIIILNGGVRVFTTTGGYFHALLAPGNHIFEVVANGYQQQRQEVEQRMVQAAATCSLAYAILPSFDRQQAFRSVI